MLCRYYNGKHYLTVLSHVPMKTCTRILHSWKRKSKSCRSDHFGQMFLPTHLFTVLSCTGADFLMELKYKFVQSIISYISRKNILKFMVWKDLKFTLFSSLPNVGRLSLSLVRKTSEWKNSIYEGTLWFCIVNNIFSRMWHVSKSQTENFFCIRILY